MKRRDEETSRYLQAVSRFFVEHRGAPFFLSPEEINTIMEWKNMGIPLQIVREGIESCFAARRKRPGQKRKILSLSFCRPSVLKEYEAYRERKIGLSGKSFRKEDKRRELKKAVENFLTVCPDRFPDIREVFSRALDLISQDVPEEIFEDLENEVETLAAGMASDAEKEQVRTAVLAEFAGRSSQEKERIQHLMLIKHVRGKYAIPHIPLYYY
jgi:hypothetical protein